MTYTEIKNLLNLIEDPVEKLEMVMDLGKTLKPIPENAECSEITGCASFVKICRVNNNFYGMADSLMVRGIVAIMLSMVDGKTADEIKKLDLMGEFNILNLNFGASRLNGIQSMISFFENL
ncbi:MAG: SufE family protein [Alphaproteobacteria bacterium]|nr:SufE family protein [Alphaproteobacteria bacterium]